MFILAGLAVSRSVAPASSLLVSVPIYKVIRALSGETGNSLFTNRRLALFESRVSWVSAALSFVIAVASNGSSIFLGNVSLTLAGLVLLPLADRLSKKLWEIKD